jgi:hypothetical protein
VDELVAFLRACLDEDEKLAHAVIKGGQAHLGSAGQWNTYMEGGDDGWAIEDDAAGLAPGIIGGKPMADHIARHDPARVLREAASKRRVLDDYRITRVAVARTQGATDSMYAGRDALSQVLRVLASAYSDQPGYRAEWGV